jgi:tRNA A37 methylthiotransferase MiaB
MSQFYVVDKSCYRRREELSLVRNFFLANHWTEAEQLGVADLVVFFACSGLRFLADEKIRDLQETRAQLKPGAELIVGGCLPGMEADLLRQSFSGKTVTPTNFAALNELPGIVTPIESMPRIWGDSAACQLLVKPRLGAAARMAADDFVLQLLRAIIRRWPAERLRQKALQLQRRNTMAFSIAAGCSRRCAYCAKPFASGQVRSKPIDVVMRNIAEGVRIGYRAFDLYADSMGVYGHDQNTNLGNLLEQILASRKRFSIGLFDLHPQDFMRYFDLIKRLCETGKLHYIYVAIQSGNERVLKTMKRPCDVEDMATKLIDIRRYGNVFMQSGVIAGFPGESDEEFEDTIRLLKRINFDNVYVHYYCDMPHTEASAMTNKVDKAAMLRRLDKVRNAGINHNLAATQHEWESNLSLPVLQD